MVSTIHLQAGRSSGCAALPEERARGRQINGPKRDGRKRPVRPIAPTGFYLFGLDNGSGPLSRTLIAQAAATEGNDSSVPGECTNIANVISFQL